MYIKELNLIINYLQSIFCYDDESNMKLQSKSKIINLIILGIIFTISPLISNNFNFQLDDSDLSTYNSDEMNSKNENLKISANSGIIEIIGNSEWVDFKNAGKCTGQGTYSDPYIIEDLEIDVEGSGDSIRIAASDVYFKIENCTVYDTLDRRYPSYSGIDLYNVVNANIINNTIFDNYQGISLYYSYNNTISGNTAHNNYFHGIKLENSYNNTVLGNIVNQNHQGIYLDNSANNTVLGNTVNQNYQGIYLDNSTNNAISGNSATKNRWGINLENSDFNVILGNTVNNNSESGIFLYSGGNNIISGNIMSECGIQVSSRLLGSPNLGDLTSNNVDSTNLVNGKPLYYYTNEINLGSSNFTNAGQVFLINCVDCLISNLNTSYCYSGIALYYCNNNILSGNTASNNEYGIYLSTSHGNDILGNNVYQNYGGIYLGGSDNNDITENSASYNEYGISLMYSDLNHVTTNTISNNTVGIHIMSLTERLSTHNEISNNIFSGNGEDIQESFMDIDTFLYINGFSILILGCAITLSIVLILWKMKYKRVLIPS